MVIGILTFHATLNFGSALQAYALQEYLVNRGHEVYIVDFQSDAMRKLYPAPVSFNSRYNTKLTLRRLLSGWSEIRFMDARQKAFRHFIESRMNLTDRRFRNEKALKNFDWSQFDMIVTGSDQIWNPSARDFSSAYFLDFLPENGSVSGRPRRAAYAPSAGPSPKSMSGTFPDFKTLLGRYEAVSVREKATAESLGVPEVPVLPDPTLLHDAGLYRSLELPDRHSPSTPYILYYAPGRRNLQAEMLAEAVSSGMMGENSASILPEDKRIRILKVSDGALAETSGSGAASAYVNVPAGPAEFIYLLDHALCTVGSSFHLMVFSLIFRKDLWCPDAASDSRKVQLLDALGIPADSTFFRFSDPDLGSRIAALLSSLRLSADSFWSALHV